MERLVKLFKKTDYDYALCHYLRFHRCCRNSGMYGVSAAGGIFHFVSGNFSKPKYIVNVIVKATPIILTGLSVVFAFKVGLFNIGAEGEYIIGTIVATVVGILVDLPFILLFPLIVLSGVAAGALMGL